MDLTNEQWQRIVELFPCPKARLGCSRRRPQDSRAVLDGALSILRTGAVEGKKYGRHPLISMASTVVDEAHYDNPDFLLNIDGAIVGAEVTDLYLPSPSVAGMGDARSSGEARETVRMARQEAIKRNVPPQFVNVRLSPNSLSKANRSLADKFCAATSSRITSSNSATGRSRRAE